MNRKNIEDIYPLTPLQQGMLFHSLADPDSAAYIEQTSCVLEGELDVAAFERAWQTVMQRHPILRTAFIGLSQKEPAQAVFRRLELPLSRLDWRKLPAAEREWRSREWLEADRQRGFDLNQAPLFRLTLIHEEHSRFRFVWTYHHALLDGWSGPLLFQEVFTLYEAYMHGEECILPPSPPYREYITWLRRQPLAEAEAFWREALAGFTTPTPLAVEQAATSSGIRFEEQICTLPQANFHELQQFARSAGLTMNTLVQAAWALLLSRYSGEDDVLFGATVAGRPAELAGVETMIGLFINTLPVRVLLPPTMPCGQWLRELQSRQVELRRFEYTPLVLLHGWSEVPRDQPLFESLLVFENYPMSMSAALDESAIAILELEDREQTSYPLNLVAGVSESLTLKIIYDSERFTAPVIRRMLDHLATLLNGIAADPAMPLADLPLLTPAERRLLLEEWNNTAQPFPADRCVQELFAAQVARSPQAIALRSGDMSLSYAELDGRANQLAHYLRRQGVGPEQMVAICTERSAEMIVAILGVLKAGAAYVPLDPTYPVERLCGILEDIGARLILAHAAVGDVLDALLSEAAAAGSALQVVALDDDQPRIAAEPAAEPPLLTTPDTLAYVIYTSGSTGRPKGTLLQHRGLVNLTRAYIDDLQIAAGDRVLQFFAFGFDGSVLDIFAALLSGATLCLPPREASLPGEAMARYLRNEAISIATLPPSMLAALPTGEYPALRALLSAGEACTREIVARWAPGRQFYNAYGPTEATVAVSWHRIKHLPPGERIPLGRPIANTRFYVLDRHSRPVPVGVPGELCIGGVGLARGYHNRPELTAEKFIADPFSAAPGARLYRSGDLVRYREDGTLDYLGRIDHQVKLRGFRIELGEIEAVLSQHPSVGQALVLLREDIPGTPRLVAYLLPAGAAGDLATELRVFLRARLPAYMVPAHYVVLEAFPLTPNGKIDRRALPAPEQTAATQMRDTLPPRNQRERDLLIIWEEVLGQNAISINDNFFDLGGHSLIAVRLTALIAQRLGQTVPLQLLYRHPTIAGLAAALDTAGSAEPSDLLVPIQPGKQRRPLFFIHPSGGSVHWYQDLARHLGAGQPFYGIQARGVNGEAELHTQVEVMARSYASAIQHAQPAGPYQIGSWSLGVILAFAVACELEARGEQISLLALFDQGPYPPGERPDDLANYLIEVFGAHIPLRPADLQGRPADQQIAHVLHEGQRIGWIYREVSLEQFTRFVEILHTHKMAWHDYAPASYRGPLTLFRTSSHDRAASGGAGSPGGGPLNRLLATLNSVRRSRATPAGELDAMGWETLAGNVEVVAVPGNHLSMLEEPHVRVLAEQLRARIDGANNGHQ